MRERESEAQTQGNKEKRTEDHFIGEILSSMKRRESSVREFGGTTVIRSTFPKGSGVVLYRKKKKEIKFNYLH